MAGEPDPLSATWRLVREGLDQDLPATHRVWLAQSRPVTLHGNTAIIAVRDDFTRTQLETKLRPRLEDALSTALGQPVRLAVTVEPSLSLDDHDDPGGRASTPAAGGEYDQGPERGGPPAGPHAQGGTGTQAPGCPVRPQWTRPPQAGPAYPISPGPG